MIDDELKIGQQRILAGCCITLMNYLHAGRSWSIRFDDDGHTSVTDGAWLLANSSLIAPPRTSLAVGERVSVTELRVGDRVANWDGHLTDWPEMTVVAISDRWVNLVGDGANSEWKAGVDISSPLTALRLPAQPAVIAPAAQVELRVGMRFEDRDDTVYTVTDRKGEWLHFVDGGGVEYRYTDKSCRDYLARGAWTLLPAAPTTTPPPPCKVAPNERYWCNEDGIPLATAAEMRQYEEQQRERPAYPVGDDRLGSVQDAWSAAVSLRLAARAEARRIATQQHCQPNWAGGEEIDE